MEKLDEAFASGRGEAGRVGRSVVCVGKEQSRKGVFTPEMWEVAETLAHPEGDPYDNARKMGFYCEQCG